jgi:hypothetical protein
MSRLLLTLLFCLGLSSAQATQIAAIFSPPPLALDGSAAGSATATTVSATITTTHGPDVIIAECMTNAASVTSVTSVPALTFTQRATNGTAGGVNEYYAISPNPQPSIVVTCHVASSAFSNIVAFGISGAKTSAPFDTNGSLPIQSNPDPLTISTVAANVFIIGLFRESVATSPTAGPGYTLISGANFTMAEYKILSSPASGLSVTQTTGAGGANGGIADAIVQGP